MPSSVAVLGPFVGGLNKASDASAIADNELSKLVNFNVDLDGSLVCRPPIAQIPFTGPVGLGRLLIIGSANIDGTPYLIASTLNGIRAFKVSATVTGGIEWMDSILIHSSLISDCAIQLHNVVYILARPDSPVNGGTWDGTTFSADSTAVKGSAALFFKGRVFVAPGAYHTTHPASSQLIFSDPVPLTLPISIPWNPVNLIPVGQGDGQNLIDMLVVADNLMLFKNNSTYAYLYDVSPNEGILRKVNNNIGVSAQFCALTHENEAYVYHEGNVYQLSNYKFVEASIKLPFERTVVPDDRRERVVMSLLGDTILVRYFDNLYALNLITKTWSEWRSANGILDNISRLVKLETNIVSSELEGYYGGSALTSDPSLMRIRPGHNTTDSEYVYSGGVVEVPIECTMTTKVFDFNAPHVFKRLMWWGVDLISDGNVVGIVNPVKQTNPVTWDVLSEYTWDQLNAWDNLLEGAHSITTTVDDTFIIRRKFIKLLKSLRFRQASFSITLNSDGKIAPEETLGPARVFSLSAIVGIKQTVVKQVS